MERRHGDTGRSKAGNPLWEAHLAGLRAVYGGKGASVPPISSRRVASVPAEPNEALRAEWNAPPPGHLGRRLLADIEPYLEFFALARER